MRGTFISGGGARAGLLLRATMLSSALLVGVAMLPVHAQAQTAERQFDIPAQSLGDALMAFGRQSGMQVTAEGPLIEGRSSSVVSGRMAAGQALSQLLAGSGLTFRYVGSNAVRLERAPQSADGAIQLGPVRVEGEGGSYVSVPPSITTDPSATERTASYTTRAMATSSRLALSPRETPQSVSVVTRQQIDDLNLLTIEDVIQNTTGLSASRFDADRTSFYARGFSISTYLYDGIPTIVDNIYDVGDSDLDMTAYDRVEIVRGSAGLLSGAGSPSAAINLVRKRAVADRLAITGSLSVGSWQDYRATLDISTPLTANGNVRARVAGSYQDKESFVDLYRAKKGMGYATIEADLTPNTLLIAGYEYQENAPRSHMYGGLPLWFSDGTRTNWKRSTTTAPEWSGWTTVAQNVFGRIEQDLGGQWSARLAYNHNWSRYHGYEAYPSGFIDRGTGIGLSAGPGEYRGRRTQDSVDVYASGPFTAFGRTHELVVGVSGNNQNGSYPGNSPASFDYDNFYQWNGQVAEPDWNDPNNYRWNINDGTRQRAIYATARFSLADPLKLIVGGRYSWWRAEYQDDWGGDYRYSKRDFTPFAGIVYDIDAKHSFYASLSDIFQPQSLQDRNGRYIDPATGRNYEAGIKGSYFDGRLNASLAVFHIRLDGLAQEDVGQIVPGTTTQAYIAVNGTKSTGIEAEVAGEIIAGWNISLGLSHYNAKDADGGRISTSIPQTLGRLFTTYRLGGRLERLTLGGGINWQSLNYRIANGPNGPERVEQGAYALVNIMGRYALTEKLSLQANVNNLLDKTYYSQIGLYDQGYYGAPRNFMVTLRAAY